MALFFYIIICRKAIKIIPAKKETFMFVMLLPVCCQQMSSFSYDVVLNSFCFLYIAYIFYLKEKQKIYIHDLIVSFLIIIIIGICKIPYVLLFLLNLMLFDFTILGNLSKKKKVVLFIEFILIIILALMISKKTLLCFNIGRLLISSIKNFHLTLKLIYRTLCSFFVGYLKSIVGPLGWFDVNVSNFLIFFVYFIMLILSCFINNNKKLCLSKKDKIICIATIILLCYFIILSMFNWTLFLDDVANYNNLSMNEYNFYIKNLDVIRGVQGRYFIPVIALLVCLFNNLKISLKSSYFLLLFYYIFIYLYYVYVLLNRYWIS